MKSIGSLRAHSIWLVLPLCLWGLAFALRSRMIDPICTNWTDHCRAEALNPLDRLGFYHGLGWADVYSDWLQNAAAIAAAGFLVLAEILFRRGGLGHGLLVLLQGTVLNGMAMEWTRNLVGRPRPFVYINPHIQAETVTNYTSFYSGHTSFAAMAGTITFLILRSRGAPLGLMVPQTALAVGFVATTGFLRVYAGMHFISDVIVGACAGCLVAGARWKLGPERQLP